MRSTFAPVAFAALAAAIPNPVPQAVTSSIAPASTAPAGCSSSYSGTFEISVVNVTSSSKRDLSKRQTDDSTLELTLSGGWMYDSDGRTGYIASNNQFQFDKPPQAGAIYTTGWSVCGNDSLALGGSTVFYQCLSGTFYNLYDESTGAQCNQVTIQVSGGAPSGGASAPATEQSDGQPTASPVSQITDGQPQASTAAASPVTQITDGQPQVSTAAPVSQLSDGQPQATTAAASPVSQLSDGQPQATTGTPTGAPVTQISDGQPQASTAAAVSQISDGQPQAPTGANTTVASPTASVVPFTGAAAPIAFRGELFGLAAAVLAIAML